MIQPKPKKQKDIFCKPIGKAFGFEPEEPCAKQMTEFEKRTYGMCSSCLWDFYHNDERGKILYQKLFLPKVALKTKSNDKAFKSDLRQKLKTNADYVKDLQKEVNTIVRWLDRGNECISTLKPLNEKYDAGHFYSCGSNPSLRFNLNNIHAQSVYANQYLSGDQTNYLKGLETVYGAEYKNYVFVLKSKYPILKLSIDELKEKIEIAKEIVKELKSKDTILKPFERIIARDIYNRRLGIYK